MKKLLFVQLQYQAKKKQLHAILHRVVRMQFVKKKIRPEHVHVCLNISEIHI